MGCDIHMCVERRRDGGWERVLPPEDARDPWLVEQAAKTPDSWYTKRADVAWYDGRNYTLFGVLANVRNGYGFAGIATGDPVESISEPRGLPRDMSPAVQAIADDEGEEHDVWLGDHSHTWLLLSEVLAYDWDQPRTRLGVVPLSSFVERVEMHGDAVPVVVDEDPYEGWSGGISGAGIVTISAVEALAKLENGGIAESANPRHEVYVRDAWTTPLRSQVRDFLERVVPAMQRIDPDPHSVRLVFGFDS